MKPYETTITQAIKQFDKYLEGCEKPDDYFAEFGRWIGVKLEEYKQMLLNFRLNTEQNYDGSWSAFDDNYQASTNDEGVWVGEGSHGQGRTEKEAIDDYWEQENDN